MEITFGGRTIGPPSAADMRISAIIWGQAGAGKTTLASTAPGIKLWINFDPDGTLSLLKRDDVIVLDLSFERFNITEKFRVDDPFGLAKVLSDNPSIGTVVLDSITSYSMLGTEQAVALMPSKNVTMEQPSMAGYSVRNNITLRAYVVLLRLTKKYNRHFIALTHEGSPINDKHGNLLVIPPAVSSNLMNQIGLQSNEIWHLELTNDKKRRILVRPGRWYAPMKSRMFSEKDGPEFTWRYDAETMIGEGMADWYASWVANGGQKIPLPGQATTVNAVTQKK